MCRLLTIPTLPFGPSRRDLGLGQQNVHDPSVTSENSSPHIDSVSRPPSRVLTLIWPVPFWRRSVHR